MPPPRANHTHPDICTYDYTVNRARRPTHRNLTISDSNNNMGVNGSDLSVSDTAVNLGAAYPLNDTQQDSGSHTNSPNCTYFHWGDISADFHSPRAAVYDHGDVVIKTEIANCHSNQTSTDMEADNSCDKTNTIGNNTIGDAIVETQAHIQEEITGDSNQTEPN